VTEPVAGTAPERDVAGVPFPPPLAYVVGLLAGLVLELIWPIDDPSPVVRIVAGIAGLVIWLVLDGGAMRRFRSAGTSMIPFNPTTALVTSGIYRFTRNPMYVGMAAFYVGIALAAGWIWALFLLPLVILAIDRLVIAREEPYLERKFGQEYADYKSRVRRWI
jgi:protein-S-isoprenylcysteine O-methyltransferase Ste14